MRNGIQVRNRQRGVSLYGWMIIIALIGFFALLGMRCFPVYVRHYEVVKVMDWAATQPELLKAPPREIRSRIQRRFDAGYVTHILAKDIMVKRTKDGRRFLEVKYDRTAPFFYNIDLLFHFHEISYLRDQTSVQGN